MVTEIYINEVINGRLYCPRFKDIRLLPCPKPPPKLLIMKGVNEALKGKTRLPLGFDKDHLPNKSWLLAILSTVDSGNAMFKKDYLPPNIKPGQVKQ